MNQRSKVLFAGSIVVVLWFVNAFALRYLTDEIGVLGIYWPYRSWLHLHVGGGIFAMLLGPVLLWLPLEKISRIAHHLALIVYLTTGMLAAVTAFNLAFHTGFGFVVGLGFTTMAIAWIIALGFTAIAAIRSFSEQYREWLTRSCVLTFGFVFYRAGCEIFSIWGHGTLVEQMSAACWLSWSVPLMITEALLQGRKLLVAGPKPTPLPAYPKDSWVSLESQLQDLN
jgi:hypothetical protein